jgi:hypothetical protein
MMCRRQLELPVIQKLPYRMLKSAAVLHNGDGIEEIRHVAVGRQIFIASVRHSLRQLPPQRQTFCGPVSGRRQVRHPGADKQRELPIQQPSRKMERLCMRQW